VKAAYGLHGEEPLLILDGEIQDAAFDLNSVSPDDIDSISVLKGQSALEFYGEKGKNGVIVITRKKATN
jgi:TonB-dependent SusC/RagA subfamily outer membrane receptor